MKTRKKRTCLSVEARNALYHKVICRNSELAEKNTELSVLVDLWKTKCLSLEKIFFRNKWWQFWKPKRIYK